MAAAIASPAPSSLQHRRDHPPYKEMILRAIRSLKERNGSSSVAISKFVASTFSNLPPTHDALLSTHIRRLKKKGVLTMVKHSYKLASDSSGGSIRVPKPRGRPRKSKGSDLTGSVPKKRGRPPLPLEARRKLGRSRKMTILADAAALIERMRLGRPLKTPALLGADIVGDPTVTVKQKMARPRKVSQAAVNAAGLFSFPKKKMGRPRKVGVVDGSNSSVAVMESLSVKVEGGVENGPSGILGSFTASTGMKKRGRPKRVAQPGLSTVAMTEKKLGRPKKIVQPGLSTVAMSEKKKMGRPKKIVQPGLSLVPPAFVATMEKKKLGRPKKALQPGLNTMPGAEASVEKKKMGRPKKAVQPGLNAMPGAEVSIEKKKLGRPKKVVEPGLNAMPGAETSVKKKKLGRTKKVGQPDLDTVPGAVKKSVEKRKPGRPKLSLLPDLNSTPVVVNASVEEKKKLGRPKRILQPDLNLMPGDEQAMVEKRKPGRPKKVSSIIPSAKPVNGSLSLQKSPAKVASTEKRKPGRPQKAVGEKRKQRPGRPRKLSVSSSSVMGNGDDTLLSQTHPSPGKVPGDMVLGPDPVPAAVNVLVGMRNPGSSSLKGDANGTLLNPLHKSPRQASAKMKSGVNSMAAPSSASATKRKPGRPRKVLPPSPLTGDDKNSVLRLPAKAMGEMDLLGEKIGVE